METKWIWVVAIVCLVVFLTAISRHRKIPGLEMCIRDSRKVVSRPFLFGVRRGKVYRYLCYRKDKTHIF